MQLNTGWTGLQAAAIVPRVWALIPTCSGSRCSRPIFLSGHEDPTESRPSMFPYPSCLVAGVAPEV